VALSIQEAGIEGWGRLPWRHTWIAIFQRWKQTWPKHAPGSKQCKPTMRQRLSHQIEASRWDAERNFAQMGWELNRRIIQTNSDLGATMYRLVRP